MTWLTPAECTSLLMRCNASTERHATSWLWLQQASRLLRHTTSVAGGLCLPLQQILPVSTVNLVANESGLHLLPSSQHPTASANSLACKKPAANAANNFKNLLQKVRPLPKPR